MRRVSPPTELPTGLSALAPSTPGWEVRYNAATTLARRGSAAVPWALLREMLDEVANFYDSEIDVRLNTITTFIEPVILVFMGSLVMTILLAMYLPLFTMIGNMGQQGIPR